MFGLLNLNKPPGWSSRDAVNRVYGLVRPVKAGHAGTLDPLATGVLVVCLGPATRLIEYVQRMPKTYRATFLLGQRSASDDVESEVEQLADCPRPDIGQIDAALPQFVGEIQQRPPAFSAVKVDGQRAYKLARRGKLDELPPRPVQVYDLRVEAYEYPRLELLIRCGSGTYVRSLGRDLAAATGSCAVMSQLVRTAIGPYQLADAVDPRSLTVETLPQHIVPAATAVAELPAWRLSEADCASLAQGGMLARDVDVDEFAGLDDAGRLRAILRRARGDLFKPAPNFSQT
ncbi:MAG: tRNA pseudouridine(55) synthase TruB [Planctomycetaceae bacterium]|nr:tRNA pseudouridine(55) synthase TruB [Planctomycetaceae bacterium]